MAASLLVDQIAQLHSEYPDTPLVIFVPRAQLGQALENAMGRQLDGWHGVRATIPRHYAEEVARIKIFQSKRTQAPINGRLFRAARLLKSSRDAPRRATDTAQGLGWHLLASTVAKAIETLRAEDVALEALRRRAESEESSETLDVVADSYEHYLDDRNRDRFYDDGDLFRWAADTVEAGGAHQVSATVYAVVGTVDLPELPYRFLRALEQHGQDFFRVGKGDATSSGDIQPAAESAAARFTNVRWVPGNSKPRDGAKRSNDQKSGQQFIRAVGARNEVKAVFRDILSKGLRFEDVEIAYASDSPYASLLLDEGSLLSGNTKTSMESGDIPTAAETTPDRSNGSEDQRRSPVTMGTGVPAVQTRVGRALRGLLEWVQDGFDVAILARMLREGLLRTDRWVRTIHGDLDSLLDDLYDVETVGGVGQDLLRKRLRPVFERAKDLEPQHFQSYQLATLLVSRSYGSGREGLIGGLKTKLVVQLTDGTNETLSEREETRLARLLASYLYVRDLSALVPDQGDVREYGAGLVIFLERFGPVDKVDKPEAERTLDESARNLLYERLTGLADLSVQCQGTALEMTSLLRRWLGQQVVAAQKPRAGRIHALPLESIGFSNRRHLYVLGLDSTTFSAPAPESGVLREKERRTPVAGSAGTGAEDARDRSSTPADEKLWRSLQALQRHRGSLTVSSRTFDIEAGEELEPSSLFLQLEQEAEALQEKKEGASRTDHYTVGLVPDGRPFLSDRDFWLRVREKEHEYGHAGDSLIPARQILNREYPWMRAGETAREKRASGEYTEHDGLIAVDSIDASKSTSLRLFTESGKEDDERVLSASRLETLAETPYIYFLKYVLGAYPLDEPALDDEPWLNHLRKGTLLHSVYERYTRALQETNRAPSLEHREEIDQIVDDVLRQEAQKSSPPSQYVLDAARRELQSNADVFLRVEAGRAKTVVPERLEFGFGLTGQRYQEGDVEKPARIDLGEYLLLLSGRVDRIDRDTATSCLHLWDYKTGRASSYDPEEPLQGGKTLQWALYAEAIESLTGETVERSGYFFANTKEVGRRIGFSPEVHREKLRHVLQRLNQMSTTGTFPVAKRLNKINRWKWEDYSRIYPDLDGRRKEVRGKSFPDDRPKPPTF
jgi:hypothetical protein